MIERISLEGLTAVRPELRNEARQHLALFGTCFVIRETGVLVDPEQVTMVEPPDGSASKPTYKLHCSFCGREIKDDHEVRIRTGVYLRHVWCHGKAVQAGMPR